MWFDLLNYPSHLQQLLHMQKYLELSHSLHVMQVANAKRRSLWKNPQLTCNACGLKQKVKSTIEKCYIQSYIEVK